MQHAWIKPRHHIQIGFLCKRVGTVDGRVCMIFICQPDVDIPGGDKTAVFNRAARNFGRHRQAAGILCHQIGNRLSERIVSAAHARRPYAQLPGQRPGGSARGVRAGC